MSMTVNELENFINSNTLIDNDYSEPSIGSMVSSYLNITEPVDLWKVSDHIRYRNPIINDFKTQEFQSAGLTWYFREGTCIDISRLSYFVGLSKGYTAYQLIVFDSSWTLGHAVTLIQTNNLTYVIDFNVILILPLDFENYIGEIGTLIQNEQELTPATGFITTYNNNQVSTMKQISVSLSPITHVVESYPMSESEFDVTSSVLIVGIVFLIIFSIFYYIK